VKESTAKSIILILTHGDAEIPKMVNNNTFRLCRNWDDVALKLFGDAWELLGHRVISFLTGNLI
jgi:hypothetical protein